MIKHLPSILQSNWKYRFYIFLWNKPIFKTCYKYACVLIRVIKIVKDLCAFLEQNTLSKMLRLLPIPRTWWKRNHFLFSSRWSRILTCYRVGNAGLGNRDYSRRGSVSGGSPLGPRAGLRPNGNTETCWLSPRAGGAMSSVWHFTERVLSGVDQGHREARVQETCLQLRLGLCLSPPPLFLIILPHPWDLFVIILLRGTSSAPLVYFVFVLFPFCVVQLILSSFYISALFALFVRIRSRKSVTSPPRSEQCALGRAYSWCGILAECRDILAWCQAKRNFRGRS